MKSPKKKVGSQRPLKDCLGLDMLRGDDDDDDDDDDHDDDDDDDDEDDVLLIKALSPLGGGSDCLVIPRSWAFLSSYRS